MYEDGSTPVIHYNLYDEWFASVGGVKTHAVNMKGIQQHGKAAVLQSSAGPATGAHAPIR